MPDSSIIQPKRPTWILYILLFLFAAPFAASWWMYHYTELGRDGGAYSHGDLILPPRSIREMTLYEPAAGMHERHLHGKWNLIYLAERDCDRKCEQRLYMMRQLWIASGRDSQRLQRVLMIVNAPDKDNLPAVPWVQRYPGQLVALINGVETGTIVNTFTLGEDDRPLGAGRLYIVDPMGNLMMSYPAGTDPVGIIKDLKRLFKYSSIG